MTSQNLLDVKDDVIFVDFCEDRKISQKTVRLYRLALNKYINFLGKPLEDLIEEAEEEQDNGVKLRKRNVTKYLRDFTVHLDSQDLSRSYISQVITSVRAVYIEHDIVLKRNNRVVRADKKTESFETLPSLQDIKLAMDYSNNTYKAIITLGLSSGMGGAEIMSLTFKHYYNALELKEYPESMKELINIAEDRIERILIWKIKRIKTGKPYFTFSSPEAYAMILNYLHELYRTYLDFAPEPEDLFFRNNNVPLTGTALRSMFRRINNRAGFEPINKTAYIRPHRLRKVFATTLEKNKFQHTATRFMMGHTTDRTTEAYFKADPDMLKEDYRGIVQHLMVTDGYSFIPEGIEDLEDRLRAIQRDLHEEKVKYKNRIDD